MTPHQTAELLVGIARAQAALLEAVIETLDKSALQTEVKNAAMQKLHLAQGGNKRRPLTLESLPSVVLSAALSPNSSAGRSLLETTKEQVDKLLPPQQP